MIDHLYPPDNSNSDISSLETINLLCSREEIQQRLVKMLEGVTNNLDRDLVDNHAGVLGRLNRISIEAKNKGCMEVNDLNEFGKLKHLLEDTEKETEEVLRTQDDDEESVLVEDITTLKLQDSTFLVYRYEFKERLSFNPEPWWELGNFPEELREYRYIYEYTHYTEVVHQVNELIFSRNNSRTWSLWEYVYQTLLGLAVVTMVLGLMGVGSILPVSIAGMCLLLVSIGLNMLVSVVKVQNTVQFRETNVRCIAGMIQRLFKKINRKIKDDPEIKIKYEWRVSKRDQSSQGVLEYLELRFFDGIPPQTSETKY